MWHASNSSRVGSSSDTMCTQKGYLSLLQQWTSVKGHKCKCVRLLCGCKGFQRFETSTNQWMHALKLAWYKLINHTHKQNINLNFYIL